MKLVIMDSCSLVSVSLSLGYLIWILGFIWMASVHSEQWIILHSFWYKHMICSPTGCTLYGSSSWSRRSLYCCRFWMWATAPLLLLLASFIVYPVSLVLAPIGLALLVSIHGLFQDFARGGGGGGGGAFCPPWNKPWLYIYYVTVC